MKRIISVLLAAVMLLAIVPFGTMNVNAATVNHTLAEAIAWCESKLGIGIDVDKAEGNQCVDLIMAYYDYLLGYHVGGNARDYATTSVPAGMTGLPGASPQPGDILVWTGGSNGNGHVAICGYDNYSYHQNWNGPYVEKLNNTYTGGFTILKTGEYASYWGVIRPNFSDVTPTPVPDPIEYDDISEGTYYIKNNASGEYVSVSEGADAQGQNVNTWTFANATYEQMEFTKASDNGYKIRPLCSSSRILNSYGSTVQSGNNVNIWDDWSESSQWWGFEKVSDGYIIRNMMNPSCVLTLTSTSTSDREIIVSTYTGANSQIWTIQNTVEYNANGGSGAPGMQLKDYGKSLTLSYIEPTRSGYTFLGWSTSSSASYATYSAGDSFTSNKNTTLYAVWEEEKSTYTINYVGEGCGNIPSSQTKTHGTAIQLSRTVPFCNGYTFLGWSTDPYSISTLYQPGDYYYVDADTTFYAKVMINDPGRTEEIPDNLFWLTHYNENTPEGAGVIFDQEYTGFKWGLHIAFTYIGYGTYEITDISNGLMEGDATPLAIPSDGFVWVGNYGNDYPALYESDPVTYSWCEGKPDYKSEASKKAIGIATTWEIGDHFYLYGLDYDHTVPTSTPEYLWYYEAYICTATFEKINYDISEVPEPDYTEAPEDNSSDCSDDDSYGDVQAPTDPDDGYALGDVNADGAIDQFDYLLVKRDYFNTYTLSTDEEERADVNRDELIDQFDYILLKRVYFGTYTMV